MEGVLTRELPHRFTSGNHLIENPMENAKSMPFSIVYNGEIMPK
jgi:hypothetical protein